MSINNRLVKLFIYIEIGILVISLPFFTATNNVLAVDKYSAVQIEKTNPADGEIVGKSKPINLRKDKPLAKPDAPEEPQPYQTQEVSPSQKASAVIKILLIVFFILTISLVVILIIKKKRKK